MLIRQNVNNEISRFLFVLYTLMLNFYFSYRWLIEVNASPSLTASSQSDYELKCRLLEDMLHIVDMENRC